jgi:hypothetical protein
VRLIVFFFRSRHREVPFDEVSSVLQTYYHDRERDFEDVAVTLTAIVNITGKSASSVMRSVALPALLEELREALKSRLLGVTQGVEYWKYVSDPDFPT